MTFKMIVKGRTASKGIVVGKARVVLSPEEGNTLKKGEILVTKMTTPDYMIFLHRAAAIITDEGGFTCHAAIVSRELGVPCIIGTEKATKMIKDGEMIKVDASKSNGVVYEVVE